MKRTNWICCSVLVLLWSSAVVGAPPMQAESGLYKSLAPAEIDYQTYIDVNQLLMFVTNVGSFAYDNGAIFGKADGLYFPRGTKLSVIYAGGLWLGGKVEGDLRVSLGEYSHTYVPGPMADGTFQEDRDEFKVYKIDKDLLNRGFYDGARPEGDPEMEELWDDYHNWPEDMGAPMEDVWVLNEDGTDSTFVHRPKITGDQTIWCVYNDASPDAHINSAGSSEGLGIEVQQTTFAFNRTGALGQCAFMRFVLINKSGKTIEEMYASVWADPDLGDASDDLVGADTVLSLGYCYNATNNDAIYGSNPPAAGYDFFQGPIEAGEETDSVFFLGEWRHGVRALPMTSFAKYINGTDPDNAQETYYYMQGLDAKSGGAVFKDPETGVETKYMLAGDPVTGSGWIDGNAADRRYMCSTGPFVMEPDDTQEVVVAVVVGQGSDRLTSVTALKFNDLFAQSAFDAQFMLPDPPNRPIVTAISTDGGVVLHWGADSEDNPGSYEFQGYNVYQGESVAGPWKRIATFDINDGTGIIFDLEFVVEEGAVVDHPVQFGSDSGIRRFMELTQDYVRGGPLYNVLDYYWAVTAYSYDPDETPKTLENAPEVITVAPQKPAGGYVYPMDYAEILEVFHDEGASDGIVEPIVVDPRALTGHDYKVTFTETEEGDIVWHLEDTDSGYVVLADQTNQTGDEDYLIVDGFQMKVAGPPIGVNTVYEVAGAAGEPVDPPDNVFWSMNSTGDWYTAAGGEPNKDRLNYHGVGTSDWELRFTEEGSEYYDHFSEEKQPGRVPFELWNIGSATPDETGDDERIRLTLIDDDESGGYTPGDWIYAVEVPYGQEPLPQSNAFVWPDDFSLGRMTIHVSVPAVGTVIRYTTNKINKPSDVFTFTAPAVIEQDMAADTVYDMSTIKVVPNPYFNQSLYEPDQFERMVKFTNLPYECEIKIFNLAGDHVVTLTKEPDEQSFLVWDMLTKHGLPLASGLYIYLVTAEGGKEFIGKMAIFTEVEQLNTF